MFSCAKGKDIGSLEGDAAMQKQGLDFMKVCVL